MRRKRVRARDLVPGPNLRALEVRQRAAHDHRDNDDGNENECVEDSGGEEGEDVVDEKDCGYDCVDYGDAGLFTVSG
jgi:hypothetical protein